MGQAPENRWRMKDKNGMKRPYLECGKIINLHGFRGEVKLESWCDSPGVLASLGRLWFCADGEYHPRRVLHASVFRQFVIARLEGIDSEEAANRLRGTVVYAAREELPLPPGGYFIADLLGLPVRHADTGELLGTLTRVDQRAHADLYTVRTPHGEELLPAVPRCVVRMGPGDAVYVRPSPGLLEGGGERV